MWQLDNNGYQPSTPEELRELLLAKVKEKIPTFEVLPAELRNNLLDEGATFATYFEDYFQTLFNWYAPSQANEILFSMFAEEQGLRRKGAYKSEVDLKFTGTAGSVIPKDLGVTTQDKKAVFYVSEETIIGTTGEVIVLAYSNDDNIPTIGIGDLNTLTINLNLQVTNLTQPAQPIEIESFDLFKSRCQSRWRNPKYGSYEGLISAIKSIDGVIQRTCTYKTMEIQDSGKTYSAINVVVSGGNAEDIAYVIYKYGGLTGKLFLSNPSDSDSNRTISYDLTIFNNTHTYKFTRAKLLNLDIKVSLSLRAITSSSASLIALTKESMQDYINSLEVGTLINKATLTEAFMIGFKRAGGNALNINQEMLTFEVKDGTSPMSFDGKGFLDIKFDEYCILSNYDVEVTA